MAQRRMPTWAGKSEFECDGAVGEDITFYYGKNFSHTLKISACDVTKLLTAYAGMEASIGTSRTDPPAGSVGAWLKLNVIETAIASYLGPILIADGYATRGSGSDRIRFKPGG